MNKIIKYFFVGCIAASIDLSILYVFTEYLGIFYLKSAMMGFFLSSIVHYTLNKSFTFENKSKEYALQFGATIVIACIGLLISLGILYILVSKGVWYMVAKIIALGVVFIFTYFMNSKITYGWFK